MSELTCDVVFYKNVNYGYVSCTNVEVGKPLGDHFLEDSVEIGRLPSVTIELKDDITEEKIDALRNQKQKVAAEAQVKMNNLEEQIQSLLAIEFKE